MKIIQSKKIPNYLEQVSTYVSGNYKLLGKIFWFVSLLLTLIPVFCAKNLVTGDAPCHMYNSKLIISFMDDEYSKYLSNFYFFSKEVLPNWISNALHIPLLMLFEPFIAEKIFYCVYVLVFAYGFLYFAKQINTETADFVAASGLILVWVKLLWMGFTNNMFSIAVSFWVLGYYLRHEYFNIKNHLIFFLIIVLLYFSHPIGYTFTLIGLFCFAVLRGMQNLQTQPIKFIKHHLLLLTTIIPTLYFMYAFVCSRISTNPMTNLSIQSKNKRFY
ncbi:MAG: hypothetical protein RML94_04025 [Bacteroidia bacterium]|nr:hypothetical protein [Bacteroidia bacterium]